VKKIVPLLLLLTFIAPFWVVYFYLNFQQKAIQKEVQIQITRGIPENELVNLIFHKSETDQVLRWEHEKEFEYQGQMYDIVEQFEKGDSVQYLCWWDKAETASKEHMRKLISDEVNKSRPGSHKSLKLIDYVKSLYVLVPCCERNVHLRFIDNNPVSAKSFSGEIAGQPPYPPPNHWF
jgi:hypothetical protein